MAIRHLAAMPAYGVNMVLGVPGTPVGLTSDQGALVVVYETGTPPSTATVVGAAGTIPLGSRCIATVVHQGLPVALYADTP